MHSFCFLVSAAVVVWYVTVGLNGEYGPNVWIPLMNRSLEASNATANDNKLELGFLHLDIYCQK